MAQSAYQVVAYRVNRRKREHRERRQKHVFEQRQREQVEKPVEQLCADVIIADGEIDGDGNRHND